MTSITIPDSVIIIGEGAFHGCSSLNGITIPDSVTCIRKFAFRDCKEIVSVAIPPSVSYIGNHAFGFFRKDGEEYCYTNFTVHGKSGSAAEKYAKDNGFKFVAEYK